jgi:hypothetical protein
MDCYFPADFYDLREDLREWCDAPAQSSVPVKASDKIGVIPPESADPSWFVL